MSLDGSVGDGLVLLDRRGPDVVVGISGFGSAKVGHESWSSLGALTGRTAYVFRYDAQELPWERTPSLVEVFEDREEVLRRWMIARMVAAEVSDRLADWLVRWLKGGRKVLLVGFSLGGYLAWRAASTAVESLTDEEAKNLEVVLVSAAMGDRPEHWAHAERIGGLHNVYSRDDRVLRYLYPLGVKSEETPAAGLGELCISGSCPSVRNLDLTDLIGTDHGWAGDHLESIVRIATAARFSDRLDHDVFGIAEGVFDAATVCRLGRWMFTDPELWTIFGRALSGDLLAQSRCLSLDAWANPSRLPTLVLVGRVALRLFSAPSSTRFSAERGYRTLYGSIRRWLHETSPRLEPTSSMDDRPLVDREGPVESAIASAWSMAHQLPIVGSILP